MSVRQASRAEKRSACAEGRAALRADQVAGRPESVYRLAPQFGRVVEQLRDSSAPCQYALAGRDISANCRELVLNRSRERRCRSRDRVIKGVEVVVETRTGQQPCRPYGFREQKIRSAGRRQDVALPDVVIFGANALGCAV